MASIKDSLLQGIFGRVGNFVICHVGDKTFLQKCLVKTTNTRSEKQTVQRVKLPLDMYYSGRSRDVEP